MKNSFAFLSVLFLVSCATAPTDKVIDKPQQILKLTQESFSSLPHWKEKNASGFAQAYGRSCNHVLKKNSQSSFGPSKEFGRYQEWQIACRKFKKIATKGTVNIRQFFEENFIPYSVRAGDDSEGLFTGYYEASLKGSREKKGQYQTPLRGRPDDLVVVDLGAFRDEFKG